MMTGRWYGSRRRIWNRYGRIVLNWVVVAAVAAAIVGFLLISIGYPGQPPRSVAGLGSLVMFLVVAVGGSLWSVRRQNNASRGPG